MKFVSTRGKSPAVSAAEAILNGIAPDGGLYTPAEIPQFSQVEIQQMLKLNYLELAEVILARFLTDYPLTDLRQMINAAYASPEKFATPEVAPVSKLRHKQYLLELFHGPTCAFKDVALQLLPYLLTKAQVLTNDEREIVILVATSGDTGKAALEGFKDVPGTKIIVFFPQEGVSQIQRMQMLTQAGNNTFVVSVKGNFDDAQNGVKRIFVDPQMQQALAEHKQAFSSANSINWGRLVPQIVYYFFGYLELCRKGELTFGDPLNVVVPTGNFGNILAAYFAREMGLPLAKLICASNSNNVLTDFIRDGHYNRNRPFYTTVSPSMDILISSNLERLLFYITGANTNLVSQWMEELKDQGEYQLDQTSFAKIKEVFYGGFTTEDRTLAAINQVKHECNMVIDTHTAVGQGVYEQYYQATKDETPMLLASTASPFKFNATVVKALAGTAGIANKDEFELLDTLAELSGTAIPQALKGLNEQPIKHHRVCAPEEMGAVVQEILRNN